VTSGAGAEASRGGDELPVGAVFAALADPTRRYVISLLAERPTVTASALAAELPISRQAIAKHLSALADAGLVAATHEGRETLYRLTPEPLAHAARWMADAGARWDERLARLGGSLAG
jgi:DNA-binding transcriptional ArsR family regulator